MKKALLVLLLVLSSITYSQDFSMTDQGNKWGYRSYDPQCDPNDPYDGDCLETSLDGYRINGETTINGTTYAIMERTTNFTSSWFFSTFIRKEEGVVYTYSESQGETILYDFNLEVGDMIEIEFEADCTLDDNDNGFADVIEVSTQFIAGKNRKVITFDIINNSNFSGYEQWIEGIGSTIDLYTRFLVYCDYAIALNCFNNGTEIFNFVGDTECDDLLSLPETPKITTSLTPNPIKEQSTLTINTFQPNTTIAFYNLLGQRISQKELTNSTMVIDRSDFPSSGMYFYQIQSEGKVLDAQKFIVK